MNNPKLRTILLVVYLVAGLFALSRGVSGLLDGDAATGDVLRTVLGIFLIAAGVLRYKNFKPNPR